MVIAHVWTNLGVYTRGALAFSAQFKVISVHGIHVSRWSSEIGEMALEVGHFCDLFDLAQDAFLASTGDEFALMGRDGAEGASSEASAMDIDGELYHVEGGDALVLIFGVGQTGVGEVEGAVELGRCHGRIGGIDHHVFVARLLKNALGGDAVAFFFNVLKVSCLRLGIF